MGNIRIKPVQPFLIIDTENYVQVKSSIDNISHFYSFNVRDKSKLHIVPDGSMDMVFVYENNRIETYIIDTKLKYDEVHHLKNAKIFGVRFMPAILPKNIISKKSSGMISIDRYAPWNSQDQDMIDKMAQTQDISEQIRIFTQWYSEIETREKIGKEKAKVIAALREEIIGSGGKVRISELGELVGYSERYINKIFTSYYGYSLKTMCKVIQFQRSLEYLDYGYPENMTDAAVELGYYDQPQFIKDFATYAHITPKRYYEMMVAYDFKNIMKNNTREE